MPYENPIKAARPYTDTSPGRRFNTPSEIARIPPTIGLTSRLPTIGMTLKGKPIAKAGMGMGDAADLLIGGAYGFILGMMFGMVALYAFGRPPDWYSKRE
jgi:hypothetical protein